jgi:arylsulfatase A-like enzyme/Flp pilus assembly protein TadD
MTHMTRGIAKIGLARTPTRVLALAVLAPLSILLLSACLSGQEPATTKARPNLLLITIDTLRPDRLSCYGSPYLKTPTVDKLAAAGVVFDRAFAHTPLTLPSHTNILLGTTPLAHGVHDNGIFKVPDGLPDLATYLKGNGYATGAFIGAFPLDKRFGLDRGFDVYDEGYTSGTPLDFKFAERKAEKVVESALSWLDGRPEPWFVWIHCFDPHQPYEPPEPFATRFKDDLYSGEVAYVDDSLTKLFQYLNDSQQAARTVVVLTGDHGQSLGEHGESTHGYFAYNSTLWVPLIIAAPGLKPGRVEANVCHIDIFPTACDLLGLDRPAYLQGRSLLPAMRGEDLASLDSRSIYFESLYAFDRRGWAPLRGFIRGSQKFIDSPIPELYDLKADFGETKNVAGADVALEKAELGALIKAESGPGEAPLANLDAAAREKLQSLGYVGGLRPPAKTKFGPEDDLKTLQPYNQKFEQAQDLYFRGEADRSVQLLLELIRERPDFESPYLFLVTIYLKTNRLAEAEALLKAGSDANPSNYNLVIEYGVVLSQRGRNDEAIGVLIKASKLIDWDPDLWNYLGLAYWSKSDFERAVAAYKRALSLDPKYAVVLANLGRAEAALGWKNKDAATLRQAMEHFKLAIENDPRNAAAYDGLGSVYELFGNVDAAITCWSQAVDIDPSYPFALYNLGKGYLSKGDKANARKYLEKYKELFYRNLPDKEKAQLDSLLERCR